MDASSSDPVLVALTSRLCQGMVTQNNLICSLISNTSTCECSCSNKPPQDYSKGAIPKQSNPLNSGQTNSNQGRNISEAEKNRRTLKQPPLGLSINNEKWQEVSNRKNNNGKKTTTGNQDKATNEGNDGKSEGGTPVADLFGNAVRTAEKSVVIYNLNLGQAPLLNPTTISAKVTSALIKAPADNFPECANNTAAAGEMVNDLLSQVKGMDLFGKGTKPCKDPRNPSKDASYYTIPVKLTFNNKQVSKHVNEILRQKYKVSTSIPYHRTLKQAITMAHEKVSKQNPGKQVLISLDAPKKALKPFTRSPPLGGNRSANSTWVSAGNPIPLPSEALNPKLKEVSEDFTLPTSPTMVSSPHQSLSVSGNQSGIIHKHLK
jgi:hypothetical protein